MGDLLQLGSSGSSTGLLPGDAGEQGMLGQDFLRSKVGDQGYVGGGQLGPDYGQNGYPLYGGAAWAGGTGSEAPIGHTMTVQVAQQATPPAFGAGDRAAAGSVPTIYAGNPDITSYQG